MTAAQCIYRKDASDLHIIAGSKYPANGTVYGVSALFPHPNYNRWIRDNDIGLMKTSEKIVETNLVRPITLGYDYLVGHMNCVATGLGPNSDVLKWIEVETVTNAQCELALHQDNHPFITIRKVCTKGRHLVGPAQRDSGGALVVADQAVGIISWGDYFECGKPDAYERISSHKTWITNTMSSM
ncbi:chymotrypsin-2-like [Phlebotomus argentipes]|uniref:chymotrypsin-2-like n=1 Tax=Phlebotomus argentipes TaxID=94469 RepID=UPI00289312C1|nr:chymotrypsin-2-like [Phlebotomus argentipes]